MPDDRTGTAGDMRRPEPPPESPLIRTVRLAARLTTAQAAKRAGISKARWSQVENGYERRGGEVSAVTATDGLLARMAEAIGLDAERLDQAGRHDAAIVLREMRRREGRARAAPSRDGDATVSVLEGALSAGEAFIMNADLDPVLAAEMVKAWREAGLGDLIAEYAARQRRARNG
jgi:transcriptional regulator with XRE-family HTH domain